MCVNKYKNQAQDPTKEGTVRDAEVFHFVLYSNFKTIAESIPETPVLLYNDSGRTSQGFVKTMTEAGLL